MSVPTITIGTNPIQKMKLKDVVIDYGTNPDVQLATQHSELPPAYSVTVASETADTVHQECTFFTKSVAESKEWVDEIIKAEQEERSLFIKVDPAVNPVR